MSDPRPLPGSAQVEEGRRNRRIVRWTTALIGTLLAALAVIVALT